MRGLHVWVLGASALFAVAAGTVAQGTPQKDVKDTDLVGKWKRADVDANDTMLIQKNKSCERNFDGDVMKGKWVRNKDGTITIGFPNPPKDKNRLTVQSCKDGKMETVSKSGLLEKWTKK